MCISWSSPTSTDRWTNPTNSRDARLGLVLPPLEPAWQTQLGVTRVTNGYVKTWLESVAYAAHEQASSEPIAGVLSIGARLVHSTLNRHDTALDHPLTFDSIPDPSKIHFLRLKAREDRGQRGGTDTSNPTAQ